MAPARFWDRASPFTTEMFLQKTDIIATIKGFGLDVNRFWWAAPFAYDWSIEKFTKCCWQRPRQNPFIKCRTIFGDSKNFEITFRVKGKRAVNANYSAETAALYGLKQKFKE